MRSVRAISCFVAGLLAFLALPVRAAGPSPEAPVREAYAITIRQLAGTGAKPVAAPWQPPNRNKLMSKSLATLFARDELFQTESGDMGHVGADPFLSGQDGEVKNLKVTVTEQPANGRALVTAAFRSFKQPISVSFRMVDEGGVWKIDDIVNRVDGKDYPIRAELSQPYECGSFMKKPCKR